MKNTAYTAPHEHGMGSLLASMAGTRLELAAIDLEAHLAATAGSLMLSFAAVVLALVAFAFIGIAVIAVFWDTHRVIAAVATTFSYCLIAGSLAAYARSCWNSRPAAFAAALRQLELDRDALRGLRS
ncbi:MAG: phage holin family protein [Pseudomonadota bacterium]